MVSERPFVIGVECYAGYRGDETPRRLHIGDRIVTVTSVLDRWLAPGHRYFKLCGDDGGIYIVRHDEIADVWQMKLFDSGRPVSSRLSSI